MITLKGLSKEHLLRKMAMDFSPIHHRVAEFYCGGEWPASALARFDCQGKRWSVASPMPSRSRRPPLRALSRLTAVPCQCMLAAAAQTLKKLALALTKKAPPASQGRKNASLQN